MSDQKITFQKRLRECVANAALQNPILVQAVGLTGVILAASTVRAALWVAAVSAAQLVLCEVLAAALLKKLPDWLRIAIYFVIGLALTCPLLFLLERRTFGVDLRDADSLALLRTVLPLLSLNSLSAVRCERYAVTHTVEESLWDALSNALGYAAVALISGFTREVLGRGSLLGRQFSEKLHIRGFWMPFGGFLLLGAMAAALKMALRALAQRGIAVGAEKALELVPEDRLERLEKAQKLAEEPEPAPPEPQPEEPAQEEPEEAPAPEEALGLSPEEKARLDEELDTLLEGLE